MTSSKLGPRPPRFPELPPPPPLFLEIRTRMITIIIMKGKTGNFFL
jgi:hypothetical protein